MITVKQREMLNLLLKRIVLQTMMEGIALCSIRVIDVTQVPRGHVTR